MFSSRIFRMCPPILIPMPCVMGWVMGAGKITRSHIDLLRGDGNGPQGWCESILPTSPTIHVYPSEVSNGLYYFDCFLYLHGLTHQETHLSSQYVLMCFFVGAFWILHDFLGPKKSRSRRKRSASKRRTFQGPVVTGVMTVEVAGMRIWNCGMACDSCCFWASGTGIPAAISNQAVPMGLKAPMKGFLVSMKWCRFPNPERALATLLHLIWASPPCWKCWQMEWLLQVPHPWMFFFSHLWPAQTLKWWNA